MIIKGEEVEVTKLETVTRSRDKRKMREEDSQTEARSSKQPTKEDPVQETARFERMAEEFRRRRVTRGDVEEKWVPDVEQMRRGPRTKNPSYIVSSSSSQSNKEQQYMKRRNLSKGTDKRG